MRIASLLSPLLVIALAGCGSMSGYMPSMSSPQPGPTPLAPQPVAPVTTQPLTPPDGSAVDPNTAPVDVAATAPPAVAVDPNQGQEVRKADLSGGWKLAAGGESCQLNMSLTSYAGGYRANTRGCQSAELQTIGSWSLNGKEVILRDASGAVVASLYSTAPGRFAGLTAQTKRGLTFFR